MNTFTPQEPAEIEVPAPKRTVVHNRAKLNSNAAFREFGGRTFAHGCAPNPKPNCHHWCHQQKCPMG
jgi:hypothetical protein